MAQSARSSLRLPPQAAMLPRRVTKAGMSAHMCRSPQAAKNVRIQLAVLPVPIIQWPRLHRQQQHHSCSVRHSIMKHRESDTHASSRSSPPRSSWQSCIGSDERNAICYSAAPPDWLKKVCTITDKYQDAWPTHLRIELSAAHEVRARAGFIQLGACHSTRCQVQNEVCALYAYRITDFIPRQGRCKRAQCGHTKPSPPAHRP